MTRGLVIAGCLSGEAGDRGIPNLVRELTAATGADVVVRARTGGRPVGASLPEVLDELRARGVGRVLVATTHVAPGRLQSAAERDVAAAAPGFERLALSAPLLATADDLRLVAQALDEALPERPERLVALAGHRGPACETAFAALERELAARGRADVVVASPEALPARLAERPERAALLAPLLMALGHHARVDVLHRLAAELAVDGRAVEGWPHSLSELPSVRRLVVAHACDNDGGLVLGSGV